HPEGTVPAVSSEPPVQTAAQPAPDAAGLPEADTDTDRPTGDNPKTRPIRMVLTLMLGGLGGYLFHIAHMPLPWMIGALIFTTIAFLSGAPLVRPRRLRLFIVPVLRVILGASFTPHAVAQMANWLVSIAALL